MNINYLAIFLVAGAIGSGFAVGVAAIVGVGNFVAGLIERIAN